MHEERLQRIGREIFIAALGLPLDKIDTWVIDRLTSIMDEQEVHEGERIMTAGEPVPFIYFMQDGRVRFTREGGPSWTLQGRWVMGGFESMSDRPSSHTVTALKDFYGMRVPAADWVELLEDSFALARNAVMNASRALTRIEERVPTGAPVAPREMSSVRPGVLSLVERLALLLDIRLLRLAGVQALADLAATSQQVSFDVGELLVERGVDRGQLICVVDGEVLAEREGSAMVRRYGAGDMVCAAAILGGVAGGWQARAVAPTRGISFPVEALFDLMEEHFDLVRSTMAALGARRELLLEHMAAASDDLVLT